MVRHLIQSFNPFYVKSTSLAANNMLEFLDIRSSHISPVIEEGEFIPMEGKGPPIMGMVIGSSGKQRR